MLPLLQPDGEALGDGRRFLTSVMLPASLLYQRHAWPPTALQQHMYPDFAYRVSRIRRGLPAARAVKLSIQDGYLQAMHIRPYKCGVDEASVLAVFDRTFHSSHWFLELREQTEARQNLELLLGHSETLIAEVESSVIGFITMDEEGYIPAFYVDRTHVGRGVGSALLQVAQDRHSLLGLHVFAKNVLAVQFYKARGFAVIEEDTQIDSSGRRHRRFEMERATGSIARR